jgi:tRNA-specific 2-thiouridylase
MSGGVDSSVAAALSIAPGHTVEGVTMLLCPGDSPDAGPAADARAVCVALGIEHHVVDEREIFEREVVRPYVDAYASGRTPNPCVVCNARVKFGALLAWAEERGADRLVTGHYARVAETSEGLRVARGSDTAKDQSYFLYRLTPAVLAHVAFPLGGLTKAKVRAMAAKRGLPGAGRRGSQETCFVPPAGRTELIAATRPAALRSGAIVDAKGDQLGRHSGIAKYTIGQRSGLGMAGGPWFVTAIDGERNEIVVGHAADLLVSEAVLDDVVWYGGEGPEAVEARVRYRATPVPATASRSGDSLRVTFARPVEGVAPGQSLVCYRDDFVLGGGVVSETSP